MSDTTTKDNSDILIRFRKGTATTDDLIDEIFNTIFQDCNLARPMALTLSVLIKEEDEMDGKTISESGALLPCLLKKLQALYKELKGEELPELARWLAIVAILCACFETLRDKQAQPLLKPLAGPLINAMETLVEKRNGEVGDGLSQEIRIRSLLAHLQILGKELDGIKSTALDNLYEKIRYVFLDKNSTEQVRLMLMELIEVRASNWCLTQSAYQYYYGQENS